MKKTLTIAIPAYNEAGSIHRVVTEALKYAQEVLVVDDGSTDNTVAHIPKNKKVRVLRHPVNQGFSGAIASCYRHATGTYIFLMPADGQIRAKDVQRFLDKISSADVVVGYRTHNPESLIRKLNSTIFHQLYRVLFGVPLREISTAILWKKKVLESLTITANPRSALIEPEVIYKAWIAGWRMVEVGVSFYPRTSGKAKGANPRMILVTLGELLRLWWQLRILT